MTLEQSEFIQRIRWHLGDMPWETTGAATSDTSVVVVADGAEWDRGDIGEFVDNGDTYWTRSVAGFDLTCTRGYYGSTPTVHLAGERILKNPKYHYSEIVNAVDSVINGWFSWPDIYKVVETSLTPDQLVTSWYDLGADALGLVSVIQLSDDPPVKRERFGSFHQADRIQFERNLPTSLVPSGVGLRFIDGIPDSDNTVYVNYAAKVTPGTTGGQYDDLTDGEALTEAIILGTVALLLGALGVRRPKFDDPNEQETRGLAYFDQLFRQARSRAVFEIRAKYPLMKTFAKYQGGR